MTANEPPNNVRCFATTFQDRIRFLICWSTEALIFPFIISIMLLSHCTADIIARQPTPHTCKHTHTKSQNVKRARAQKLCVASKRLIAFQVSSAAFTLQCLYMCVIKCKKPAAIQPAACGTVNCEPIHNCDLCLNCKILHTSYFCTHNHHGVSFVKSKV